MEDQQTPAVNAPNPAAPLSAGEKPTVAATNPASGAHSHMENKVSPKTIGIAVGVIVVGIIGAVVLKATVFAPKPTAIAPTPVPTITPTPTPIRAFSPIASQSAFFQLETSIASLSGAISAYNPDDPSLSPPALVLPLGFSSN